MAAADSASPFLNRHEAGRVLAARLLNFRDRDDVVVLGLPRGGVPVAFEVAEALHARLDVFVVRRIGVPWQPELAVGAIASGGVEVLSEDIIAWLGLSRDAIEAVAERERTELARRESEYRRGLPPVPLENAVAIVVDDGLATGASMRAAIQAVRAQGTRQVVAAVPVGSPETCAAFAQIADDVVCAMTPARFSAVGQWYVDFAATLDEEVRTLLALHAERAGVSRQPEASAAQRRA